MVSDNELVVAQRYYDGLYVLFNYLRGILLQIYLPDEEKKKIVVVV